MLQVCRFRVETGFALRLESGGLNESRSPSQFGIVAHRIDPPVVRGERSRLMATPFSDDVPGWAERISPRHVLETRIWIRLQREGKKLSLQGWSRDLSESGLGAFVAEALVLSESVTLEIPLPDCDKQVIPAKVVRAQSTDSSSRR